MSWFWGKRFCVGLLLSIFVLSSAGATAATPRLKPAAPGPEYLSRLDHARLLTIHAALEKKQFSLARAETKFVDDPTAKSLAQWLYLMAKDPNVDLNEAGAFLNAHPDWPATDRIQSFVESRIVDSDSPASIRKFFSLRAPRSGDGKIQLARAMLADDRSDEATALIRDAWINHNYTVAEERRILQAYKSRLTKEDHAARVDRLLWAIQVTNSRRTFPYLSKKDRRMAEARAALLMRASSAERLYNNLPAAEQIDAGVLHAAVRFYRRTNNQREAIALAAKAPIAADALRNPDRWWTERRLLVQWALKEGLLSDAYKLAAEHGGADGTDFSDAEFLAGWIALRFLNEPERAITHFEAMTGAVATPISLSRGYYWLGRAAAAAGDTIAADGYYRFAADYHYSYYGQLAAETLGDEVANKTFAAPLAPSPADRARFNSRPAVAAMRMLSDLNLDYELMVFAYHVDDELERPGEYVELAKITNGEGAPHLTVRAGKVATQRGAFAPDVAYPLVFVPDEARAFVSPEIILGLSRQESEFNPRAFSRAGARGVMQLIPSTAQITAKKEGLPYRRSALLDDPVYNMTLGSAHLSHLLDRFDGSLIMTFAAYNAGAQRVDRWTEDFGDPRTNEVDPVDWVELIPFSETRNYVQRVLENTQVYRGRLNDASIPGRLAADIERGGPRGRIASTVAPSVRLAALAQTRGGAPTLADLPPQTAQKAAAFREERLAALTPAVTPTPSPSEILAAPLERKTRRSRRNRRAVEPIIEPQPSPLTNSEENPEPAPIALAIEAAPSKTENIVSATPNGNATPAPMQPPAYAPAPSSGDLDAKTEPTAGTLPEDAGADAIAQLVKDALAEKTAPPPMAVDEVGDDRARAEFAEHILEKAAGRLQITDESDALAAAIVRGLEQMDEEEAEVGPLACDEDSPAISGSDDDAAALNAMMAAQLRDEGDPCGGVVE